MKITESLLSFIDKKVSDSNQNSKESFTSTPNGEKPLVSVVVPNFNYDRFLEVCLRSILSSSLRNIEVILIDSSSKKSREKEIKSIIGDLSEDSRLRVYYRDERKNGDNRNYGISKSESDFICTIDPDDLIHPHFLLIMLYRAEKLGLDISGSGMVAFGEINEIWHVKQKVSFLNLSLRNELASNSLFKKKLWTEIGGFIDSSGSPHIHEDWRFWHRASKNGSRIGNVDRPLVCIRIHGKNMSWQPDILPPDEQSKYISFYNKDLPLSLQTLKQIVPDLRHFRRLLLSKKWKDSTNQQKNFNNLTHISKISTIDLLGQVTSGKRTLIVSTKVDSEICTLGKAHNQYIHLDSVLEKSEWFDFYRFLTLRDVFDEIVFENE